MSAIEHAEDEVIEMVMVLVLLGAVGLALFLFLKLRSAPPPGSSANAISNVAIGAGAGIVPIWDLLKQGFSDLFGASDPNSVGALPFMGHSDLPLETVYKDGSLPFSSGLDATNTENSNG